MSLKLDMSIAFQIVSEFLLMTTPIFFGKCSAPKP